MTNTTYTLQLVPKGWKVVPEEPTTKQLEDMMEAVDEYQLPSDIYNSAVKAAPPLNTPPLLRWENQSAGMSLLFGEFWMASAWKESIPNKYIYCTTNKVDGYEATEQEARRAAEKALGFPDGLIIEEV